MALIMTNRILIVCAFFSVVVGTSYGCAAPVEPNAQTLRLSFAAQVASIDTVHEFARDGDDLTFIGPDGSGGDAAWLVHIDSAVVESVGDESTPDRGVVMSTWYRDGELIEVVNSMSLLPEQFLDQGIGQECWALWETSTGQWDW